MAIIGFFHFDEDVAWNMVSENRLRGAEEGLRQQWEIELVEYY